jgi:glycosyltransferase involved in cell wall biosynthesis
MTDQESLKSLRLSVIVACSHSRRDLDPVLSSLRSQEGGATFEIIVADGSGDSAVDHAKLEKEGAVMLRFPQGTPLPALWGAGIRQSHGALIAITDDCSIPDKRWVASILTAHESSDLVVGGAVDPSPQRRLVDWAAYFCEYGQFMLPLPGGDVSELPGNNIAFKRVALGRGTEFVERGFWKTYWCRALQREGVQLRSVPDIVVYDRKSYRLLPFLVRRYHHGRCFAGMRTPRASRTMRVLYGLGTPLLPLLFMQRIAGPIMQKQRYLPQFILSLPISILAVVSWSWGEFCGYLVGPGRSCEWIR